MRGYLRSVAVVVVVFGVLVGVGFASAALRDEEFRVAALRKERNPGDVLFDTEFRVALARRVFLLYTATSGFVLAVIGGSVLWGLASLHEKVERLERAAVTTTAGG